MDVAEFARLLEQIVKHPLFTIQGRSITLVDLVTFAVFVLVTLVVSRLLRRSTDAALSRRGVDDPGTRAIARRLIHYVILFVGLATAVNNLGFNLSAIFAAGAVLGVGIGFAFQSVAQNFIAGMLLLFERTIKPGDVLEVEGMVVRVEDLRIRCTVARTRDDEQLIGPNSALSQGTVKNFTMEDSLYRVTITVGVTYDSDMRLVRRSLEEAVHAIPWRVKAHEPMVLMTSFADSCVEWNVSVWTDDPWHSRRAQSELHEAVWWALKDAGIVIAFPQLDVHLDPEVSDSLTRLPKAS
jgi:small-conductance mechanosensitive channel